MYQSHEIWYIFMPSMHAMKNPMRDKFWGEYPEKSLWIGGSHYKKVQRSYVVYGPVE